ncbi:MAG: MFS transporter [Candidatus Hermodarchaeota archaeon]
MTFNNLEKIKRRNLIALAITRLIHGFGTGIFMVVYQPYLLELTNSIFLTGLFISIGIAMQFLPMPLIGKFSDRNNRKYVLILSIPIYIIGLLFLIIANTNSLQYAIFGIILYFLGFSMINLNTQFLVSENSNKSKGLIFGFMFFSYFGGNIGGTLFIMLGEGLESRFYFTFFIILLFFELLVFIFFISGHSQSIENKKIQSNNIKREKENIWVKIFKVKSLRIILIFFILDIFVYSISLSIYSGGLNDYYKISKEHIAFVMLWFNITNAIFQIPAGGITDKIGKRRTLILSQFFGMGFFLMNILSVILWMNNIRNTILITISIGYILLALSLVTFVPAEQIMLTNLGENQKAESYGVISFFRGIGLLPTGIIGGLLVENIHYIAPFILSIIGVIIELIYLLKFFQD